jgi:putative cardiolipin synthase
MHPLPASGRAKRRFGSSGASLHAKAIVVDRRFVVIGSLNLDPRSRLHNTEVAMLIESAELGAQVAKLFEHGVDPADTFRVELAERDRPEAGLVWLAEEDGKPVRYTSEPAGFWKRFAARLLSLFVPEHML